MKKYLKKDLTRNRPLVYTPIMDSSELSKWRKDQGYTQRHLADLLGVDVMTVSRWERNLRNIPPFLHLALKYLEVKGGEAGQKRNLRRGAKGEAVRPKKSLNPKKKGKANNR